tara:strand:+ start:620 stop:1405 length:786 start_codon:yes stop_codon:yes gene_type:complete
MEEKDKPKKPTRPSDWVKNESKEKKNEQSEENIDAKKEETGFDKNGNLFIKLGLDDSALVVRADGSVEMVSHDLENADNGYVGDVEDLNKTFSLVLALASALENEDLYNRIFHNLNMTLMKKWDNMPDNIKEDIVEKRKKLESLRDEEGEIEKHQRIDEFRKRMNKYKETFLDDMDEEKRRLKKDLRDEEEFHKRYGRDFGADHEYPEDMMEEKMESKPRKKVKKKKNLLPSKGVDWNPYDKTLKAHWKPWHVDEPPPEED